MKDDRYRFRGINNGVKDDKISNECNTSSNSKNPLFPLYFGLLRWFV